MRAGIRAALPAGTAIAVLSIIFVSCGGGGGRHLVREGCIPDPPPMIEDGFREPDVRVSEDGVLETTLKATYSAVNINGHEYKTLNYNDSFPGPTLVVCPGDRLIVHLVNDLGAAPGAWGPTPPMHHTPHGTTQLTNLHTHGLHVSPRGNSDNVFLSLAPGQTFTYEYKIPDDHRPGLTGTTRTGTASSSSRSTRGCSALCTYRAGSTRGQRSRHPDTATDHRLASTRKRERPDARGRSHGRRA